MKQLKERMDTLSDAIIAIAITILVLEIQLPADSSGLKEFFHQISLFMLSFFVIANYWYHRSRMMVLSQQTSLPILVIDLLGHLFLCLIPLFTRLMFEFEQPSISTALYGTLLLITSSLFSLTEYQLAQLHRSERSVSHQALYLKSFRIRTSLQTLVGTVLIVIGYFFPQIGIYLYVFLPLVKFRQNLVRYAVYSRKGGWESQKRVEEVEKERE